MCGRFALVTDKKTLEMLYRMEIQIDLQPRFNIAPTQDILVLRLSPQSGEREMTSLKWGLVPFWAKDETIGSRMINARSETAAEKPSFREAFKKRRLLIPVSGFFEWKEEGGAKQPYYIYQKDGQPFSLAGLWERWEKREKPLESCTILTVNSNSLLAGLHDRMPVIISPDSYEKWLDPGSGIDAISELLKPYSSEELDFYPVSRKVNKPGVNTPDLLKSTLL